MKVVRKRQPEPVALASFRQKDPTATWDDAHADNSHGQSIPQICCTAASDYQG